LIVEDVGTPPYAYDEERLILLSDYFSKTDDDVQYGLTANPFVWSGETDAVLINGVGVAKGEIAGSTADCSLPVIHVEPGKTYRWRFIGGLALSMVQFGIVGHDNLTIVAADGQYTLPHTESYIQITSGQRYDVIFRAKSAEELAGGPAVFTIQFETKERPEVYYGYGVLRYSNTTGIKTTGINTTGINTTGINKTELIATAPATPPLTLSNITYDWLEYALEPLKPNDFPTGDEVTRRVYIYDRQVLNTQSIVWQLNGLRWNETSDPLPNEIPYLVNIYEHGQAAIPNYEAALKNGGWDNVTSTWPAKIGEVRPS
jgi:L-ascorbate oxidase